MKNKVEIRPYNGHQALFVNDVLEMSDMPLQVEQYEEFFENYRGDILILGLGMGVLNEHMDYDKVTSVDVIELYQEVIDINKDYPKTTMKQGDAHTYVPTRMYDVIWIDCWNLLTIENLAPMRAMVKKLRPYLKEGGYIHSWGLTHLETYYGNMVPKE